MAEVVDLTHDEEEGNGHHGPFAGVNLTALLLDHVQPPQQPNVGPPNYHYQGVIPFAPVAKPSISYGPGRGGMKGWFRAYVDNDVKRKMNETKQYVKNDMAMKGVTQIPRNLPVTLKAWFFLKRPASDFVDRQRGFGRLKQSAISDKNTIVPTKPDDDNLAKFLMDALTGASYVDDAQVVEIHMVKLRDSVGMCWGRIAIDLKVCEKTAAQMMPDFL